MFVHVFGRMVCWLLLVVVGCVFACMFVCHVVCLFVCVLA